MASSAGLVAHVLYFVRISFHSIWEIGGSTWETATKELMFVHFPSFLIPVLQLWINFRLCNRADNPYLQN